MARRDALPWIAGGLGAAALYYLMTGSKPRPILATRYSVGLEDGWRDVTDGWTISVKVADGATPWLGEKTTRLVTEVTDAGRTLWAWGYHYFSRYRGSTVRYSSDVASAVAEAEAAAEAVDYYGASAYCVNAEKQAFGAWGAPGVANVGDTAAAFAMRFRELQPAVDIIWNGLSWTRYLNTAGAWQAGLSADALAGYDAYMPMLYREGPDTAKQRRKVSAKWTKSSEKAAAFGLPWMPMLGTVAVGNDGESFVWAFDRDGAPGVVSDVARTQPAGVAFFYGPKSRSRGALVRGNAYNPSLARLADWMRTARREGASFAGTAAHPDWTPGGELVA